MRGSGTETLGVLLGSSETAVDGFLWHAVADDVEEAAKVRCKSVVRVPEAISELPVFRKVNNGHFEHSQDAPNGGCRLHQLLADFLFPFGVVGKIYASQTCIPFQNTHWTMTRHVVCDNCCLRTRTSNRFSRALCTGMNMQIASMGAAGNFSQ